MNTRSINQKLLLFFFHNSMTPEFNIKTCPSFVEYAAQLFPNEHSAEICWGGHQVFLVREKNHKNIIFLCFACEFLDRFSSSQV